MKKKKVAKTRSLPKIFFQVTCSIIIIAVVAVYGVHQLKPSHAATSGATLSVTPTGGTYTVGSTVAVSIYEDSGTDAVSTIQADLTYPSNILAYASVDNSGSQFTDISPPPTVGGGVVSVARGGITAQTGTQKVVTVDFTVLQAGSASVAFASSSQIYRDSDLANIYAGGTGGTYTARAAVTTPPVTTPVATPPPPTTTPITTTKTATPTTTYTPKGTTTPVTVAKNVPLTTSQDFTAAPVSTDTTSSTGAAASVTQVQYLLNGKLVATRTSVPFSYDVQTKELRNGTYTLTTKTKYSDGDIVTASQKIKVNNPYDLKQLSLDAKHYAWLSVPFGILFLVAVGLGLYILFRSRNGRMHGYARQGISAPTVTTMNSLDATVIEPTVKPGEDPSKKL
jgi:hypothetical protein